MTNIRFATASEVFRAFETAADDIAEPPCDEPTLDFFYRLARGPTPEDAISFAAYFLGKREAVWWGCACVRHLAPGEEEARADAFDAAESWVKEPGEEFRLAAMAAGQRGERTSAAVWLALAAGWSGGSMVSNDVDYRVPTPAHLTAKCVRAGILLALARVDVRRRLPAIEFCVEACRKLVDVEPDR